MGEAARRVDERKSKRVSRNGKGQTIYPQSPTLLLLVLALDYEGTSSHRNQSRPSVLLVAHNLSLQDTLLRPAFLTASQGAIRNLRSIKQIPAEFSARRSNPLQTSRAPGHPIDAPHLHPHPFSSECSFASKGSSPSGPNPDSAIMLPIHCPSPRPIMRVCLSRHCVSSVRRHKATSQSQ